MTDSPIVAAWDDHPKPVDETLFTPWAQQGWMSWNGQSPELEVCDFVQLLVRMMQPRLVIETGVGQGYMTRVIVPLLAGDQRLVAFESDDLWRQSMWSLRFWEDNRFVARISADRTPSESEFAAADLCVIDSDFMFRFMEIELWQWCAKPGAVAVIHDTAEHEGTVHSSLHHRIIEIGMTGFFLHNPRGSFVAVKPQQG